MLGMQNEIVAVGKGTYNSDAFSYTSQLRLINQELPAVDGINENSGF